MRQIRGGAVGYRTKLMGQRQAVAFALCLQANARFSAAVTAVSDKARGQRCWFVSYFPASEKRLAALVAAEQEARVTRAIAERAGYRWDWDDYRGGRLHVTTPGGRYSLDENVGDCTCPDCEHRCEGLDIVCKHVAAARMDSVRADLRGDRDADVVDYQPLECAA